MIKDTIINKLIPSIKENFPKDTSTIIIQLDGSSDHSVEEDPDIKRLIFDINLPITFRKKPQMSPYLNVLDLGYFDSIQGLQYKKECETVNDLVSNLFKSYEELE